LLSGEEKDVKKIVIALVMTKP